MRKRRWEETHSSSVSLDAMTQWQQEEIDAGYWEELIALDPAEVCRGSLATYDPEEEAYRIPLLHQEYTIHPSRRSMARQADPAARPHRCGHILFDEAIVLIIYLLRAREIPLAGKQQTEKELPGGEIFFRGPHELARRPILKHFGCNPEAFHEAAAALGGQRLDFGDAAFRFQALPRIPLDYILWVEDDEFPARLTIAFDPTVSDHLPLDVVWALVHLATRRLVEAASACT